MTLKLLRRRIVERGGLCPIWVVYEEDRHDTLSGKGYRLLLVRAFWSRSEGSEWALARHAADPTHHYHVYQVIADEQWVVENTLRGVRYVTSYEDSGERPGMSVTAGAVANVMGDER